jgi:hypothetical protein
MMTTEFQKEEFTAGVPFDVVFEVTGISLAGCTALIQLRDKSTTGPVLAEWDDNSPELIRDEVNNTVTLIIPPLASAALKFKVAYMDLWLYNDSEKDGARSDPPLELANRRGVSNP